MTVDFTAVVNTIIHIAQFSFANLEFANFVPVFIVRAGNIRSKIFNTEISTEDC